MANNASSFQNRGAAMNTKIVSDAPNEEKLVDATEQANEVSQLAAAGKGGLCAPPVLTSDQRLIVTPYSTVRFAFNYTGATGIATPVATQLTAFSWGYQDSPAAAGILAAEAGRINTSADSDGYVHDTYPFLCKGITFAPKGLVHASATAAPVAANTPVADGNAITPSINFNFSDTDASLLYDSFINSTFMSFVLQGETCELLLGLNHLFPAGLGPKGGAFVTNGEPRVQVIAPDSHRALGQVMCGPPLRTSCAGRKPLLVGRPSCAPITGAPRTVANQEGQGFDTHPMNGCATPHSVTTQHTSAIGIANCDSSIPATTSPYQGMSLPKIAASE
jgi:hypothetical protein